MKVIKNKKGISKVFAYLFSMTMASALLLGNAQAASIMTTLAPFTGDPAQVKVTIDDLGGSGDLKITAEVTGPIIADLRGLFFHISDEALIGGLSLSVTGDVTQSVFGPANSVSNLGGGNNLNGGGTPCSPGCDLGFEIGVPGIGGGDDFQMTMFTLTHNLNALDLSLFANQLVGARVTSVDVGGNRTGSSKLTGTFPDGGDPPQGDVPEPGMMLLFGFGLAAFGFRRHHRKA